METNDSINKVENISRLKDEQATAVAPRPALWKSPYKNREEPAPVHPSTETTPPALSEEAESIPGDTPTESIPVPPNFDAPNPAERSELPAEHPNRNRGIIIGSIATVAAAGLLSAGGIFISTLGQHQNRATENNIQPGANDRQPVAADTASAATQPSAESTTVPEAAGPQAFAIPEISASQDPGQIGTQVLAEVVDGWRSAGIPTSGDVQDHKKLAAMQRQSGLSPEAYAASISQQAATAYANNLFIGGAQSRSDIQTYIQRIQPMNEKNIYLSIRTANDPQEFFWGIERDDTTAPHITVTENAGDELDLSITYTDIENAAQNSAAAIDPTLAEPQNVSKNERLDVKLLNVNGAEKISAITAIDLPAQ